MRSWPGSSPPASGSYPEPEADIGSFKPHDVYPHALSQLADLGMPTRDVLRSATSEAVGRGRLRPVADADLLVLGSSPIEDMSAVRTFRRYTGRPTAFADPAAALVVARKEAGATGLTCSDPCRPSQLRGRARMLGLTRRRGRAPEPRSP